MPAALRKFSEWPGGLEGLATGELATTLSEIEITSRGQGQGGQESEVEAKRQVARLVDELENDEDQSRNPKTQVRLGQVMLPRSGS